MPTQIAGGSPPFGVRLSSTGSTRRCRPIPAESAKVAPSGIIAADVCINPEAVMSPKPITDNTLFYGDNLPILREYIPDESVDLIYLDPPFNSNRSYNVLFKDETGHDSES